MNIKLVVGSIGFFAAVGVLVSLLLFGPSLLAEMHVVNSMSTHQLGAMNWTNAIARENALPGTAGWEISQGNAATIQIQAYASTTSVVPGKTLMFYVSTQKPETKYSIDIYRMGWYGGIGARLMTSIKDQLGRAQGYYDDAHHKLLACESCRVDQTTGLIEARWKPSFTLTVPQNWTTGVYLAKLTDATGHQTYVPFDVLGNTDSAYIAVTSDTTYAAYNEWGGASLYKAYPGVLNTSNTTNQAHSDDGDGPKAAKVSFDKPYLEGFGSSGVLLYEIQAIRWMERQGYDLSYMSSVDLHVHPDQLLKHKAYISLGHDEYWSKEMRDGVEVARDHGVGLAFTGADAAYWQMRFEPDSMGTPNRTVVCYKVLSQQQSNDYNRDPLYGKDNARLTTQWRDPVVNRPENTLIGIMYSDLTHKQFGFPWKLSSDTTSPLVRDTGLRKGQEYSCGVVGYEWDRIFPTGTPKNLHVLATSDTVTDIGQHDVSNTTYYIAPSGAMVFASGSIYFDNLLDSWRFEADTVCGSRNVAVAGVQELMSNVMKALVVNHPVAR